ncbi:nitroreductase [Salinispirillum marinum]|uniref:Nitroreductase n=2 Tax=Saccharospirillaceae TaxID=255527 RepID=A0ABV8BAX8_9GAMM
MLSVTHAMHQRRSTRRFLPMPIAQETVETLLQAARRAPSGANLQPGFVHVLSGAPLANLCEQVCAAFDAGDRRPEAYTYFPDPMPEVLKARQRTVGYALYNSLGIARRDLVGRKAQHRRNFTFFDAPVGLVVTIDRAMGAGCYMDLGMFLQSIFLLAEEAGLATCGIGALASYSHVLQRALNLPEDQTVVCGIALGYADTTAPENQFPTERAGLAEFARFSGF